MQKVSCPGFWGQSWDYKVWAGSLLPLQISAKQLSICFTFLKWSTLCFILQGAQVSFTLQGSQPCHALRTSVRRGQSTHNVSEEGRETQGDDQCRLKNRSSRMCQGSGVPIRAPLEGSGGGRHRAEDVLALLCQLVEQIMFPSQIHTWQWMAFSRWHV